MKTLIATSALICLLFSCKKNEKINTDEVRLQKTSFVTGNNTIYSTTFNYDAQGRIIELSYQEGSQAPHTVSTISYNGNEILITTPQFDNAGLHSTDQVRLTIDAEGKPLKRVQYSFYEWKAPVNNPQRTYVYDTVVYEYGSDGLLLRAIGGYWDTTWFNPGTVSTSTVRKTSEANYLTVNGNVSSINKTTTTVSTSYQAAGTHIASSTTAETSVFGYTQQYANKTDFTNTALLNELGIFYPTMNKRYRNLPDHVDYSNTHTDPAGAVTVSNSSSVISINYNSYGFVSSLAIDPAATDSKLAYTYNK